MKKLSKILAAIVAVIVVLLIALIVLANVLITPERVRETVLPLAEKNLNRKVDLGNIEVSLFSGIEIHGLTVFERNSEEVFVSTDLIRLKYQLLPLLAMKVVVDEVRLEKPNIRVARLKDGQFNFSDLLGEPEKGLQRKEPSSGGGKSPISLLVSNVHLSGGQLTFLDYMLNDKSPYRYQVSELNVAANGVSLTGKIPVEVSCMLNGSALTVAGDVSLVPFGGDFDIELQSLDVVAFSPYLKDALPGKLGGLKLTVKTNFAGTMEDMALKGDIKLAELDFVPDALPEAALKEAAIDVNYDMQFNQPKETLKLTRLGLDYNGIKATAQGELTSVMSEPAAALDVSIPALEIRNALKAVPAALAGDVSSLDPAGKVAVDVKLAGALSAGAKLLKSARVTLDNVQATAGGHRPALSGALNLAADQLTSDKLFVRLGDNRADINLTAKQLFSETIVVNADVSSERFALDPLLKGGTGSAAAADKSGAAASASSQEELGPFDIPLHATGTVKVGEAAWKGLSVKNFLARYELKNNILNVTRLDGQVAGGSFNNTARVDLGKKGLAYSASLGLQSIQADPLLSAFSPKAAGALLGAMNLDLNLKGHGTRWETLSKKLNGQGNMLVADGRVISPGLVKGFAAFLQLPNTDEIAFSNFKGNIKIEDGKVKLDSSINSDQIRLYPKGDIGLDGNLNLSLDTRLSPQTAGRLDSKGKVTQYLTDDQGWSQVPLLVTGNYASPSFGLDPKGVKKQAEKALSNELGRQLNKFLGGSKTQEEAPAGDGKETSPDPAGQLLQKLFGN